MPQVKGKFLANVREIPQSAKAGSELPSADSLLLPSQMLAAFLKQGGCASVATALAVQRAEQQHRASQQHKVAGSESSAKAHSGPWANQMQMAMLLGALAR